MFSPLRTDRLLLRPVRSSDCDALHARRNDPAVAELQSWALPFARKRAEQMVEALAELPDPPNDDWWMLTICDLDDTVIHGDLALRLEHDGRSAEVGYSLDRASWGHGFAREALTGLVDWLFDVQGVSRAMGMLHPDNERSARVLESCGFVFEGHTRNSYWIDDENSDDWLYGMTPQQRAEWNERRTSPPATVELVEPDPAEIGALLALGTHRSQRRFVEPIATSLAQVAVPPYERGFEGVEGDPRVVPWARVIHADGAPVGFVLVEEPTDANPEPYLWRLLIDRLHQRRRIGKRVVELVIEQVGSWGCEAIHVSYGTGVGSPEPLYQSLGFEPTGAMLGDEVVARLTLSSR